MRILLLSKADLFGNAVLNRLLPGLLPRHEVAVQLSDRTFRNERGFPATDRFMHYTRDLPLERLFPVLDARRLAKGDLLTFGGLAERYNVPFGYLGGDIDLAREAIRKAAAHFRPDAILCCRHDFIVPTDAFGPAAHGAYNTHSGALPYYRGPFCSFWSMMNREEKAGCSLHTLKKKVDTGDSIGTAWITVNYEDTLVRNLMRIYDAGAKLFLELEPRLRRGPFFGLSQPPGEGVYYRQPKAGDYAEFARRDLRLVEADDCRRILERYLPDGANMEEFVPDWQWEGE